jgi:hypothetical protein
MTSAPQLPNNRTSMDVVPKVSMQIPNNRTSLDVTVKGHSYPSFIPGVKVYGVPFSELMEKQKEKYGDLGIPYVLAVLVDCFFKLDGPKTEGIFR